MEFLKLKNVWENDCAF